MRRETADQWIAVAPLSVAVAGIAALTACDGGTRGQPSGPQSTIGRTASASSTPGGARSEVPHPSNGESQPAACEEFRAERAPGQVTRYETRAGSTWWVTYGIATNGCADAMRITGVRQNDISRVGTLWLGRADIRVVPVDAPPADAYWPGTSELPSRWHGAVGTSVTSGQRLQIAGLVRLNLEDESTERLRRIGLAANLFRLFGSR